MFRIHRRVICSDAPRTSQIDNITMLTAALASIGTAAVPGVGIVMLTIVLISLEIPESGIALILGVDRPLDMCRTVLNVTGDATVATVVASSEGMIRDPEAPDDADPPSGGPSSSSQEIE